MFFILLFFKHCREIVNTENICTNVTEIYLNKKNLVTIYLVPCFRHLWFVLNYISQQFSNMLSQSYINMIYK